MHSSPGIHQRAYASGGSPINPVRWLWLILSSCILIVDVPVIPASTHGGAPLPVRG
jgi:hypothetical protein